MRPLTPSELATVLDFIEGDIVDDPHGVLKALATLEVQHKCQIWEAISPALREQLKVAAQAANS